jgi:hypothetical protein
MDSEIQIKKFVYKEINGLKHIPKEYVGTIKQMVSNKFKDNPNCDKIVDSVIANYFNT